MGRLGPILSLLPRRRKRLDMSRFAPLPAGGYLVGGAVRDTLLGRESNDLDWLVEDPRLEAEAAGERLGSRPFQLDEDRNHWRLVAAERTLDFIPLEGSLERDLRSRDFTINALAADERGEITDVTGGLDDLRRKVLRMNSEAVLREDPLRLLRAVRLRARLGFSIEPATRMAVREGAELLERGNQPLPAWERVREELDAIILSPAPGSAMSELEGLGLLSVFLPELSLARGVDQGGFHHLDVLDHSLEALQRVATIFPDASVTLRWATLFHDVGKPETRDRGEDGRVHFYGHDRRGSELARKAMKRLRRPADEVDEIAGLVRYHMVQLPRTEKEARRFAHRRGRLLPDLLKLMIADREAARGPLSSQATRRSYRVALSRIVAILDEEPPPEPLLDGREVMELLGLEPGPRVGEALRFIAEARAVGDIRERDEAVSALHEYAETRGWAR
ncbi:MAG TPA: HD domain-containing protein [Trueperaceae bacterium]